jgi:hypothetical protein
MRVYGGFGSRNRRIRWRGSGSGREGERKRAVFPPAM